MPQYADSPKKMPVFNLFFFISEGNFLNKSDINSNQSHNFKESVLVSVKENKNIDELVNNIQFLEISNFNIYNIYNEL